MVRPNLLFIHSEDKEEQVRSSKHMGIQYMNYNSPVGGKNKTQFIAMEIGYIANITSMYSISVFL